MPSTATRTTTIREEVRATLKKLKAKDPGLRQALKDAYAYAVFPSVGKAALVVGGAYGHGAVFEQGELIGFATIGQTTIGVQVGGETFSEVILFEDEQALERFRQGKLRFAASASAVLVKAGATGTNNYEKGVQVLAYSRGGMLLEAAIGGQKFKFKTVEEQEDEEQDEQEDDEGNEARGRGGAADDDDAGDADENEEDQDEDDTGEEDEAGAATSLRGIASTVSTLVKQHPIASALIGTGLAAGAVLLTRAMRSSGSDNGGGDEQEQDEDDRGQDEEDED